MRALVCSAHDRIDFVYYSGIHVTPKTAQVLGYDANDGNTDIGIRPYPSDHRAVVVEFDVPACSLQGDLNRSCTLSASDWSLFRAGQLTDLSALRRNEAYLRGDLNGDLQNDHADFVLFKLSFDATNGAGAFAAMLISVPEPPSSLLAVTFIVGCMFTRKGPNAQRRI